MGFRDGSSISWTTATPHHSIKYNMVTYKKQVPSMQDLRHTDCVITPYVLNIAAAARLGHATPHALLRQIAADFVIVEAYYDSRQLIFIRHRISALVKKFHPKRFSGNISRTIGKLKIKLPKPAACSCLPKKSPNFIQLYLTLTKLCHIKRDPSVRPVSHNQSGVEIGAKRPQIK